jgi:hypothetical protein
VSHLRFSYLAICSRMVRALSRAAFTAMPGQFHATACMSLPTLPGTTQSEQAVVEGSWTL